MPGQDKKDKDVKISTKHGKVTTGSQEASRSLLKSILRAEGIENICGVIMNIWTSKRWKKVYAEKSVRSGIRLSIEKNVDPEVRRAIKEFTAWMRKRYSFPIRVRVYVKSSERIKALDGDMVCGTIFMPDSLYVEPYIRLATGDYNDLEAEIGKDNALAAIIRTFIHEVTHYYQGLTAYLLLK